jgi:hypothetical protein
MTDLIEQYGEIMNHLYMGMWYTFSDEMKMNTIRSLEAQIIEESQITLKRSRASNENDIDDTLYYDINRSVKKHK